MKFWLFLIGLPSLLSSEIIWQADIEKPFAIILKLNSSTTTLDDLLNLDAHFQYPNSYELKTDELLNFLTWSANPLAPQLSIDQSILSPVPAKEGLQAQHLQAKIRPLKLGSLDLSFLIVTFLPKDKSLSPFHVLTPVFSVQVLPSLTQINALPFAPLMPLEPQFPLDLTQANRQWLDDPQRIEEEKKRIQYALKEHSFPWLGLLVFLGCGGLGWTAYLLRAYWPKYLSKSLPMPSPIQQALQALQALQERHLLEQNLISLYVTELISILLRALQNKLGRNIKNLTTTELSQILQNNSMLSAQQKEEFFFILTEINPLKYAAKSFSIKEAENMYQKIQLFIQRL